jgi:hypothetical protein
VKNPVSALPAAYGERLSAEAADWIDSALQLRIPKDCKDDEANGVIEEVLGVVRSFASERLKTILSRQRGEVEPPEIEPLPQEVFLKPLRSHATPANAAIQQAHDAAYRRDFGI